MRARPASPAAGSRWPMPALTLPTATSGGDLPSAPDLCRVAQSRAGPVRLELPQRSSIVAGAIQCHGEQQGLCRAVGCGEACTPAILPDRRATEPKA
eukprot:scaffold1950_cov72-Phaeocystis_antarctica.AAC.6